MSHQYKITSGTLKVGKNFLKAVQKPRLKVFDPVGKVVPALPANPAVDAASMDVQLSVVEEDDVVGLALAASTSVNPPQKKAKFSPEMAAPRDPRLRARVSGLSTSPELHHKVPAGLEQQQGALSGSIADGVLLGGGDQRHGPFARGSGEQQHGLVRKGELPPGPVSD